MEMQWVSSSYLGIQKYRLLSLSFDLPFFKKKYSLVRWTYYHPLEMAAITGVLMIVIRKMKIDLRFRAVVFDTFRKYESDLIVLEL